MRDALLEPWAEEPETMTEEEFDGWLASKQESEYLDLLEQQTRRSYEYTNI
jgi:hypothetical protein